MKTFRVRWGERGGNLELKRSEVHVGPVWGVVWNAFCIYERILGRLNDIPVVFQYYCRIEIKKNPGS